MLTIKSGMDSALKAFSLRRRWHGGAVTDVVTLHHPRPAGPPLRKERALPPTMSPCQGGINSAPTNGCGYCRSIPLYPGDCHVGLAASSQ